MNTSFSLSIEQLKRRKSENLVDVKRKSSNEDMEFYISRYPFPQNIKSLQIKYYKTFYECQGCELTTHKVNRLTNLNKIVTLIKVKQIGKNIIKNALLLNQVLTPQCHNYSLFYQVIPYFILSTSAQAILKQHYLTIEHLLSYLNTIFQQLIETFISLKIYYLIDIHNIGITQNGKIKIYVPAKFILEQLQKLPEARQDQMRLTYEKVVQHLGRYVFGNEAARIQRISFDVDALKIQIIKDVQRTQLKPKNIESQIFTFNGHLASAKDQQQDLQDGCVQDLKKTLKIRKNSEKLDFVPDIEFHLNQTQTQNFYPNIKESYQKCATSRDMVSHEFDIDLNQLHTHPNNPKESQFFKQKMKDYEQKLNSLNNTVKQMKQELLVIGRKDSSKLQKKQSGKSDQKSRKNSPLLGPKQQIDEISVMVQKLSQSKIEIKKLLNDRTDLRHSYNLDEQSARNRKIKQIKDEIEPIDDFEKEFQTLMSDDNDKSYQNQMSQTQNYEINIRCASPKQNNIDVSKYRTSLDYESSFGKQSFSEQNPFREYGHFRLEYAIDGSINSGSGPTKKGGNIKIHVQPLLQPYRIVRAPVKKQHVFYPLVQIKEPYRYSGRAIAKDPNEQYEFYAIPEDLYDPSQYDSIDTFEMELGKQYQMPIIVKKDAFRHTYVPSYIIDRFRQSFKQKDEKLKNHKQSFDEKTNNQHLPIFANSSERKLPRQIFSYQNLKTCPQIIIRPTQKSSNQPQIQKYQIRKSIEKTETLQPHKINKLNCPIDSKLSLTHKHLDRLLQQNNQKSSFSASKVQRSRSGYNKQKIALILSKSKQIISKYKKLSKQ